MVTFSLSPSYFFPPPPPPATFVEFVESERINTQVLQHTHSSEFRVRTRRIRISLSCKLEEEFRVVLEPGQIQDNSNPDKIQRIQVKLKAPTGQRSSTDWCYCQFHQCIGTSNHQTRAVPEYWMYTCVHKIGHGSNTNLRNSVRNPLLCGTLYCIN